MKYGGKESRGNLEGSRGLVSNSARSGWPKAVFEKLYLGTELGYYSKVSRNYSFLKGHRLAPLSNHSLSSGELLHH